jgi:hypothetical protein
LVVACQKLVGIVSSTSVHWMTVDASCTLLFVHVTIYLMLQLASEYRTVTALPILSDVSIVVLIQN